MNRYVLKTTEYNAYYKGYIDMSGEADLLTGLQDNLNYLVDFINKIPEDKLTYLYAEGKWTIKEVIQHLLDTERVFAYRALCIARNDRTAFPGFEQNDYIAPSKANIRSMASFVNELKALRMSNIALFENMDDEMLGRVGTASNSPLSARAAGFIIIGHWVHHCKIIKERYL